jgi:hypothetical protein
LVEEDIDMLGPMDRMLAIQIAIESAVKQLSTTKMTDDEFYMFMQRLDPTGAVIGGEGDSDLKDMPEKERLPYLRFVTTGIITQMAREMGELEVLTRYEIMVFEAGDGFVPFPSKHFLFMLQEGLRYHFRETGRLSGEAGRPRLPELEKWVEAYLEDAELPWEDDDTPQFATMLQEGFTTAPWKDIPLNQAINMTGFAVRTFLVSNIEAYGLDKGSLPEAVGACVPFAYFITVSTGIYDCIVRHLLQGKSVLEGKEDPEGSGMFSVKVTDEADLTGTMWGV